MYKRQILEKGIYTNPSQALSGSVPGLKVTLTSGNPTSSPKVILRGGTEFDGSGGPLVIVDGQLRDNCDDINPQDIASMDVLKDAGATARYGARASNGVIDVYKRQVFSPCSLSEGFGFSYQSNNIAIVSCFVLK